MFHFPDLVGEAGRAIGGVELLRDVGRDLIVTEALVFVLELGLAAALVGAGLLRGFALGAPGAGLEVLRRQEILAQQVGIESGRIDDRLFGFDDEPVAVFELVENGTSGRQ